MNMNDFSEECIYFLQKHQSTSVTEDQAINFLKNELPISTRLDWADVTDKIEIPNVPRNKLKEVLVFILSYYEISLNDKFYVLNLNDVVPFLETSFNDWLSFIQELDYADTIFIHQSMKLVIHWDFYAQVYAKKLN